MNTFKRPYEEVSSYSAFQFPRNVRARLCLRQKLAPTPSSQAQFSPILRTKSYTYQKGCAEPKCKENIPPKSSSSERKIRIRFHQKVAVHSIPARHHYSEETKRKIWNDTRTLRAMARRNTIEFASEGYDWRRATEDDAMILSPTGERIHPVWKNVAVSRKLEAIPAKSRKTSLSNPVTAIVRAPPAA